MRKRSLACMAIVSLVLVITIILGQMTFVENPVTGQDEPATIVVAQDGSGDHTTITDALASASNGDKIEVMAGTYEENIVVDVTVNLVGAGNDTTFIKGDGTGDVVSIDAGNTNFEGFTVSGSGDDQAGIAIRANSVTIDKSTCTKNSIGILANGTTFNISGSTCSNNTSVGILVNSFVDSPGMGNGIRGVTCSDNRNYGIRIIDSKDIVIGASRCDDQAYGIYIRNSDDITIHSSIFNGNSEDGVFISGGEENVIERNICTNTTNGNGISISHSTKNRIGNNLCSGNKDGLYLNNAHNNSIVRNVFTGNNDGIHLETSENNHLESNNCSGNSASGIHLSDDASLNMIRYNALFNNTERGIYLRSSSSHNVMEFNSISGNKYGIRVVHYSENNSARENNIFGNVMEGIHVGGEAEALNASGSWWGKSSGPNHATLNPNGAGDNVTDFVSISPWVNVRINSRPIANIQLPDVNPLTIKKGETVYFEGDGSDQGEIIRYRWTSSRDGDIYNGTSLLFNTSLLSPGQHTISLTVQDDCGAWSDSRSMVIIVEAEKEDDTFFLFTSAGFLLIGIVLLVLAGGYYMMNQPPNEKMEGNSEEQEGPGSEKSGGGREIGGDSSRDGDAGNRGTDDGTDSGET